MQKSQAGTVAYIVSSELVKVSSLLPSNRNRSLLVHTLIKSFGLLHHRCVEVVKPCPATLKDLTQYHDREYLDFILSGNDAADRGELIAEWGLEDVIYIYLRPQLLVYG
jgi:histone deacetylase 8